VHVRDVQKKKKKKKNPCSLLQLKWYTKRGLAAAVYGSTELFMLQDQSEDLAETWAFLDERLAEVGTLGRAAGGLKRELSLFAAGAESILRSRRF
jgi:ubiquinone biosynthesis protein COQ9